MFIKWLKALKIGTFKGFILNHVLSLFFKSGVKFSGSEQEEASSGHHLFKQHYYNFLLVRFLNSNGVDIELISRILGHASTQTTRIYTIPSLEMLKEAMEKGVEVDDHES